MFKAIINDHKVVTVDDNSNGSFQVDGNNLSPDIVLVKEGIFHVILDHKSYNAEVIRHDAVEKTFYIRVNNNTYKIQVRDKFDELLRELGMDNLQMKKVADLKAPMPGLVVEVSVEEGQEIKKGDRLVVLEAMKMENILKAPADATVKKINVTKGKTVEKNEILVLFV